MSRPVPPDNWEQLEPLLDAVLDAPPERRATLAAELSGGSASRRSELERLVAECERGLPFLDRPAAERFAGLFDESAVRVPASLAERYPVISELGRGGMAVVYLARDLKHGRDVAVKVVRPELAAAVGRERFLREIDIVAGLHHPHVVPLYDSGEADGFLYYVMPYEPGHSLRERLAREGPLPVNDAVFILRDVCDALAYAHQHAVVHRDIKPDNVLLSGRHAMVTDFGVARALSRTPGETAITTAGVMLGTPAYMAPEQIAADPHVDHRADIYAVGVLAYELLTGRPPFGGRSQDVLTAHLTQAPESLTTLRPELPAALVELVMKCLEKQPAARWQSADDMLSRLEGLATPPPATVTTRRSAMLAVAVLLVAAAVTSGALLLWRAEPPRLTIARQTLLTSDPGLELFPALSPDGRMVAYAAGTSARMRIYVRPVAGGRTWTLSNDTSAVETEPKWSPDGEQILFLSHGGVSVAPSLGGSVRPVVPGAANASVTSAAWSPDATEIAALRGDSLLVFSAEGARSRLVARGADWHSCTWSPARTWLACVVGNPLYVQPGAFFGNLGPSAIVLIAASDGRTVALTGGASGSTNQSPQWSANGSSVLFVSNRDGPGDLYAVALRSNGQPRSDQPVRLTTGLGVHTFSVDASNGHLAYAVYQEKANLWSLPIPDRPPVSIEGAVPVTFGSQVVEIMRPSFDGQWLYYDSNLNGNSDIYRIRIGGGEPERLTSHPDGDFAAHAAPSGTEFAYHRFHGAQRDVFVQQLNGAGAQQVTATDAQECCPIWSPDGSAIAIAHFGAAGGIFVMRRDSAGRWSAPVRRLPRGFLHSWSPDGRHIAVASGRTIRGTRHAERLELISPDSGDPVTLYAVKDTLHDPSVGDPHWSPDGRGIYFKSHDELGRASIWHQSMAGGPPRLLVRFGDLTRPSFRSNFTTDGKRFFFAINDRQSDVWMATLQTR